MEISKFATFVVTLTKKHNKLPESIECEIEEVHI